MNQEFFKLESLQNTSRAKKRKKLLGRGPASGHGKTCCRGHKGAGSRSGYKIRAGNEGGRFPLYRKLPTRGFSNVRFAKKYDTINLDQIEHAFNEGETVSLDSLREKGFIRGTSYGIKVLAKGSLSKKLHFDVQAFSASAQEKLSQSGIKN